MLPVKASVTVVDSGFHAMGDINWDGIIDSRDKDLMQAAWRSKPGDPNWNPDADLNGDGVVGLDDLGTLGRNLGKDAPMFTTPSKVEVSSGKCVVMGNYKAQKLRREFTAGTRVAFVFTALGMFGRVVIIPI